MQASFANRTDIGDYDFPETIKINGNDIGDIDDVDDVFDSIKDYIDDTVISDGDIDADYQGFDGNYDYGCFQLLFEKS